MVQPQGDCPLQWEMAGEEGALRVPPELASNEVVTRLLGDNQQLREALRLSNQALRARCEEMEGWQRRAKDDREFLRCRFQEARSLVERLAQENSLLRGQANGPSPAPAPGSSTLPGPSLGEGRGRAERRGPPAAPLSPEERGMERRRTQETESQPQSLGGESVHSSVSSAASSPPSSIVEAWAEGRGLENPQPIEGGNEFLQLLKSHKEKLEEGMRELRSRNAELEREKEEGEREREVLLRSMDHLRAQVLHSQACGVTEETMLQSDVQHSSERHRELQEKLDCLQKSSAQRDRTDAILKQRDKDCAQLAKDCESLKAQATSLLGELRESRSCLEKSEHDRKLLEDKLSSKMESLQVAERELELLRKQQNLTVDKLLLQTQNLETALKAERHLVTEERKKLTQLQHAYTCLFRDYDSKLKTENQGGNLCSRLEEAEKALALKQDRIDKLKEEVEQQRGSLETVPVLTAQAEIYKADFLAEREAREKLHQRKEELQDQLTQALAEIDRLKQEGTARARMEEMQQRHLEDFPAPRPHIPAQQGGFPGGAGGVASNEELPDYRCPKCQYQAPDMDTLQIHVMDCIQ